MSPLLHVRHPVIPERCPDAAAQDSTEAAGPVHLYTLDFHHHVHRTNDEDITHILWTTFAEQSSNAAPFSFDMESDELDKDMVKELVLSEVMHYRARHAGQEQTTDSRK